MSGMARIETEQREAICLVRVHGEIDISNAHQLTAAIEAAMPKHASTVVVDLSQTSYLDSAGIQLLFTLAGTLKTRRHTLTLVVPEDASIRAVIELTGLPAVVSVVDHMDAAPAPDR